LGLVAQPLASTLQSPAVTLHTRVAAAGTGVGAGTGAGVGIGIGAYNKEHLKPCMDDTHQVGREKAAPAMKKLADQAGPAAKDLAQKAQPHINNFKEKVSGLVGKSS